MSLEVIKVEIKENEISFIRVVEGFRGIKETYNLADNVKISIDTDTFKKCPKCNSYCKDIIEDGLCENCFITKQEEEFFKRAMYKDNMDMNKVEEYKKQMNDYIKNSIDSLEHAMNIVECDDTLNDGQSEEAHKIYKKLSKVVKELEDI